MADFDIEEFLRDPNNLDVYDSIRRRKICKTDQELDWFLGLVTEYVKYVNSNKDKPLQTSRQVKGKAASLSVFLKQQFYEILIKLLCNQYDESLEPCIQLIFWDYLDFGEEFKVNNEFGMFMRDTTYNIYSEDLLNFKLGQGIHYEENGRTYLNQWALHDTLRKQEGNKEPKEVKDIAAAKESETEPVPSIASNLTERQQALFFYFLKREYKIGADVDTTTYATVVANVLNKKPGKITNSNIYKFLANPFAKKTESERATLANIKDLEKVKALFITIGDNAIVKRINQEIRNLENGIE